ncbi:MAG: helix-turn-helix transcriptional regulator [Acidocella sp.]|nr:helix-turn-helix transcriptional regulator [Acidocella sp.]
MKACRLNTIQNWPELAMQANWSVTRLAGLCGVSRRTLHRYFASAMGAKPKVCLATQRHKFALDLLQNGSWVKETSSAVGYHDRETFSREFKRLGGQCPSETAQMSAVSPNIMANPDEKPRNVPKSYVK